MKVKLLLSLSFSRSKSEVVLIPYFKFDMQIYNYNYALEKDIAFDSFFSLQKEDHQTRKKMGRYVQVIHSC
jgi:hypothetical protein